MDEPHLHRESDKDQEGDDTYAVYKNLRHAVPVSCLWYAVPRYGYSNADDTAEPPQHIHQEYIDVYRQRFEKRKKKLALMETA